MSPSSDPGTADAGRLLDPALYSDGDPFALYAELRRTAPVCWIDHEGGGFWAVTTHPEVSHIGADPGGFCSSRGILTDEIGTTYETPPTMMHTDPPQHTRYRRLVQPGFKPSMVRLMEAGVTAKALALLDQIQGGVAFDVVQDLSIPFPLLVICELLGVDGSQWPRFFDWSEAVIPGEVEQTEEQRAAHQVEMAGNETTRNLISGGLVALAENPAQWAALQADRSLIPKAIEELLRWTTPVISFMRTATAATTIRGVPVAAGDPVLLVYASANRDEEVFGPDAGELRIDRHPNPHVSFGFGPHFCLGAALARLEGRVVLGQLLDRFDSVSLAGPVQRTPSPVIAGVRRASLVFS